jgi:L-serine dehydratase
MSIAITTSIFDIFKIGPGPSSSHTIGPMKAAGAFLERLTSNPEAMLRQINAIDVYLYGSLSATGLGHGTHKAILAGLLGWTPEDCDADLVLDLMNRSDDHYTIIAGVATISFTAANIHFSGSGENLHYQNTLRFEANGNSQKIRAEYYSIGGGFIRAKGEKKKFVPPLPQPFSSMADLRTIVQEQNLPLHEVLLQNEEILSCRSRPQIEESLDIILETMQQAVKSGLETDGLLPGTIGLQRKACVLYKRSLTIENDQNRFLATLNSYALAASEENAAGRKVVTAPTSGSAGIIPAIVCLLGEHFSMGPAALRKGLVAAAAIGFIARHNASIAGAEVGCQGEVGVASAMAAAFLAHANGASVQQVENAAEIALEHHLGLTCDPIDGYVQIPCIERNAMGAVSAYNSYILATVGESLRQKISFDQVVEAMRLTGKEMSSKYKETAQGGLAVCYVHC